MAVSTTSFEERLQRINARAAAGANGFVTPGVVDADTPDASAHVPKVKRSYLGNALGGVFMSLCVMALGVTFVLSDIDTSDIDQLASSLLTPEN